MPGRAPRGTARPHPLLARSMDARGLPSADAERSLLVGDPQALPPAFAHETVDLDRVQTRGEEAATQVLGLLGVAHRVEVLFLGPRVVPERTRARLEDGI